jgi:hypothetical protein
MDVEALARAACARTGLSNFGPDTWREGLEVLVRALNEEAALSPTGENTIGERLTDLLAGRLEIEDWLSRHPEIGEQPVNASLVVLGLPRTGSTALGNLLALDPERRYLRTWEVDQLCPPPEAATEHTDPRIAASEARIARMLQALPEYAAMLPSSATGPMECLPVMALDFRSPYFQILGRMPSYTEWLYAGDMEPAYRYHRRVLQLLQWRQPPRRWWLRSPAHMSAIGALDRTYPGARFIMTHRDIAEVIPSAVALAVLLSSPNTEDPDPAYLGRHQADIWETSLRRLIAFRDAGHEDRFFDIGFMEMQSQPIEVIRRLYAWLGDTLSAQAERQMVAWWRANAETRTPALRRRPEDFGLDADKLRERFSFYTERFRPVMEAGARPGESGL